MKDGKFYTFDEIDKKCYDWASKAVQKDRDELYKEIEDEGLMYPHIDEIFKSRGGGKRHGRAYSCEQCEPDKTRKIARLTDPIVPTSFSVVVRKINELIDLENTRA